MPAFNREILVQPQSQLPDVHPDGAIFDRAVVGRLAEDGDPNLALIEALCSSTDGILRQVGKQRRELRRLLKRVRGKIRSTRSQRGSE